MRFCLRLQWLYILLCFILLSRSAMAFEYAGQAWCCDTIHFQIDANPLGPDPGLTCGSNAGFGWFAALIDVAATQWNSQGTRFRLVNDGTTLASCSTAAPLDVCIGYRDRRNVVGNNSGLSGPCNWVDNNVLAYATWRYWTAGDSAGCIFESDICFNWGVDWYTNQGSCGNASFCWPDCQPPFCFPPCTPPPPCYDVISVALHEFGHWIAANHENDTLVFGYRPVMYSSFRDCEMRRTPSVDDIALLQWGYDVSGSIGLPARTVARHLHPADADYDNPPARMSCVPCACDCHADPANCDGVQDITDVVQTINVAFRGAASILDPNANCPYETTDVNCGGSTDVIDVVKMVNVAFRGANAATEFCNPCP